MSSKDYEKFEKKLLSILNSSANAKAWSDLLPMTKEILNHLTKYQGAIDFSQISTKYMLAKRLAQCLNPEFPNGVHEVVLDIYKILFTNIMVKEDMQLMDNLALYASGLFPFFSHASLQNKNKFLNDIVRDNLLSINPDELTICFPGLLASLIPGLDDNNDSTTKLIFQAFEDFLVKLNNKQTFFGSYWTLLLRNKQLRTSGIKYLLENIIKYIDLRQKTKEEQKIIIENYYPNINTTVINALCEIIKDEDIPTVRNGMDFILTRFPLSKENDIINDNAKINLIINALHLLIRNESSVIRRLNNWLSGINNPDDDVDYDSEDMDYKMNLIIEAFNNIFDPKKNYSNQELINKLKILNGFFETQKNLTKYILPKISYFIIKCVVNYWQKELNSSENVNKDDVINRVNQFFNQNKNCELLWISLAEKLKTITEIQIIDDKDKENEDGTVINDTSKNRSNNVYNHLLNEINDNIGPLKFCLLFVEIKTDIGKINYYFPIITHLLNIINKIQLNDRESLKDIRHIILITLVFIKTLQENIVNNKQDVLSLENSSNKVDFRFKKRASIFQEMINTDDILSFPLKKEKKGKYYICEESSLKYILAINKNNKEIMNSLTQSILNYQEFYINFLRLYFQLTKDMQITKFEINIFKQCSELVLRLQEYGQQEGIPLWIYYLEKLIFYPLIDIKISLESVNFFLDLYSSSFNNSKTYQNLKIDFLNAPLPESVIEEEILELIMCKTGANNNCYELLMGKLYLNLLEQINQRAIIDLLVTAAKINTKIFEKIVLKSISYNTFNTTIEGIKLFSEFWKLANELYPDEIFFNSGECIFKMVDYLDNKNPLLRHLSKTWLNQVNQKFSKILDPIIGIFLCDEINILFDKNQVFFEKEFNTSKILEGFSKLKNIILNSPVISFLTDEKKKYEDNLNLQKIGNINLATLNYLCLLISISLRFTQAKCKKNISSEFKFDSFALNAASCEFLEFLVNLISDDELLLKVANEINRPLLQLLDKAIENNDEVMQVQILAVIKIIGFNSPTQYENNPEKKKIIFSLLKENLLSKVLIKGMTSDYYFVRENFINFTKNCLPILGVLINKKKEFENVIGLGINFISGLTKYLSKKIIIEKVGRKDNEKFSHFDKKNNKVIFKNYLEEYKEYKLFDENDILLILKGIKDILLFFININQDNLKEEEVELQTANTISFFKKSKSKTLPTNISSISNIFNNNTNETKTNDFDKNWIEFKKNLVNPQKQNNGHFYDIYGDNNKNERTYSNDEEISIFPKYLYNNHIYNLLNGLILAWVNQSDKYEVYDYCLNINGVLAPTAINSWNNISNVELKNAKDMINKNPIKKVIIEIALNLFSSNPTQFIEKILDIWCFGQKCQDLNSNTVNATIDKQFQLSIIELLISMNVPLNIIFYCINQILIDKLKTMDNKNKKYKKDPKTKMLMTPYEYSLYEAKIFHFIYSYILLNPIYDQKEITEIWKELTNIFYTIINNSKIIYTFCWLYEVMQLSLDKFQIKLIDNNEITKSINETFNIVTTKLMEASFDNKLDSLYLSDEKLVIPVLPHIYTNIIREIFKKDNLYIKNSYTKLKKESQNYMNHIRLQSLNSIINDTSSNTNKVEERRRNVSLAELKKEKGNLSMFYEEYYTELKKTSEYNIGQDENSDNKQDYGMLNLIYRQLAMITLKENYIKLYISIFGDKLSDIKKQLTEILKGIISLIKSKDSLLKECASDFLVSLMEDCPKKVTKYGKELIMNFFNEPSFFKTDTINLHNWTKIMSHYADYYPEIITDLLNNIDGKSIFLLKTNDEDKIRILRRISFVIYSCKKDTFSKQFDLIQSKAKDLLSGYGNNNNILEGEIFLMMRVLFLRFSHEGVMKMIRDLWPIIFTELIQNIENNERNKNIHVVAESFKFIELLSLANIEEFSLYEWIFIIDTYNKNYLDTRNEDSMLNRLLSKENKAFKPLAITILSKGSLKVTDKLLEGKHEGKSELYIKTKKYNFEELFRGIKQFFYSIIDMNSYKVPVNFEQIEQIMEGDFLAHYKE